MASEGVDWVAVAGILGTLGGVFLGAISSFKIQERLLRHEDRTRFQESRAHAYARLARTANEATVNARTTGVPGQSYSDFLACFEEVRLLCSAALVKPLNEIHGATGTYISEGSNVSQDAVNSFNKSVATFIKAARSELGTNDA